VEDEKSEKLKAESRRYAFSYFSASSCPVGSSDPGGLPKPQYRRE
jgi:hypothetical protein